MILCFQLPHQPEGAGSRYVLLLFEISHFSSISEVVYYTKSCSCCPTLVGGAIGWRFLSRRKVAKWTMANTSEMDNGHHCSEMDNGQPSVVKSDGEQPALSAPHSRAHEFL